MTTRAIAANTAASAHEGRDHTGDPRDVFLHDVDLPLDHEREYVLDRDQVYELPRAADLWVQASREQRQRFQQLFFPEGIAFDGNGFVRTAVTAPAFSYLPVLAGIRSWEARFGGPEPRQLEPSDELAPGLERLRCAA